MEFDDAADTRDTVDTVVAEFENLESKDTQVCFWMVVWIDFCLLSKFPCKYKLQRYNQKRHKTGDRVPCGEYSKKGNFVICIPHNDPYWKTGLL